MMNRIIAAGIVLAMGSAAHAVIAELNFGYELLAASYDGANTFSFMGHAPSAGDIRVTQAPTKGVSFRPGELSGGTADISGSMTVGSITATTASGNGSFTLTDVDGSTISASISGTFTRDGIVFFLGNLSDVTYTFADNEFNGSDLDKFTTSDFNTAATIGNLVLFEFERKWFTAGAFSSDTIQLDGSTRVPEPGTALLLILALAACRVGSARRNT